MADTSLLIYFNGFNSAILDDYSGNPKIVAVEEFARSRVMNFLPVSVCYRRARLQCSEILAQIPGEAARVVFCGSSMGGWYARIMQLMLCGERPDILSQAIAFNPVFDLDRNAHHLLGPQQNFVTLERYQWSREHGDDLVHLERSVDYDLARPFFVFVDKGDEVIPWQASRDRHQGVFHFQAFEGGCHSFEHYAQALAIFDSACDDNLIR